MKSYNQLLQKYPFAKNDFFYHKLDITKQESVSNIISLIRKEFSKIDYLVNNAKLGTLENHHDLNIHNTFLEVNVYGTINFKSLKSLKYFLKLSFFLS